MDNESNRLLLRQLEAHASEAGLLNEVKAVSKNLKNLKIYKNRYLIIDPTTFEKSKKTKSRSKSKKRNIRKALK